MHALAGKLWVWQPVWDRRSTGLEREKQSCQLITGSMASCVKRVVFWKLLYVPGFWLLRLTSLGPNEQSPLESGRLLVFVSAVSLTQVFSDQHLLSCLSSFHDEGCPP